MRSQGAAFVAMAVEATDEVPAILVAEGDSDILGGHLKLVDHVPPRKVPRRQVEASLPPCGRPDGFPVVGTGAWRPVLTTQRDKAEPALTRQLLERCASVGGQRRLPTQMVLRRVKPQRRAWATTILSLSKSIRSQRSASSSPGRRPVNAAT